MTENIIYLLDLNYTLVSNSHVKKRPFIEQIAQEEYRQWLVDLLVESERPVILITARPAKYHPVTLDHIIEKTGWEPDDAYFNIYGMMPHLLKPKLVQERIWPRWGQDAKYIAIESNPKTHATYEKLGIVSYKVNGDEIWETLPAT